MVAINNILAAFPPKVAPLFSPSRWKVMYGGRGSGKSWSAVRALLLLGQQKCTRILCCREFMASMEDSVHQLLSDQIQELGLGDFYRIERKSIYGINGTEIRFAGLKTNPSMIRSFEKIDIAFCEEAANISKTSWDILIPTIRSPNSEIWVVFNPDLETDNTFIRFVVNPPKNAWICQLNYTDNPYFPEVLKDEMEELKERNYEDYCHVYLGQCRQFYDGSVFINELRQCEQEDRVTRVNYDPALAVQVAFDLGWGDATSIWCAQRLPTGEVHLIDYYESHRKTIDHYLKWLSDKPYPIDTLFLPHDAKARTLAAHGKSVEELIRNKGFSVKIVPNLKKFEQINALRMLFPNLYIDRDKCEDGLQSLRHYRYEVIQDGAGGFKNEPVHDRWSHGADAAMYMAIGLKAPKKARQGSFERSYRPMGQTTSWMGL